MEKLDDNLENNMPRVTEQIHVPAGKTVCLVFAVVCAIFVPINLAVGNLMMTCINGAISVFMLAGYWSILKSRSLKFALPIIMLVLIFVAVQYLITGGEEGFSILWVLLIPPFAIYMLDLRDAVAGSLLIWVIVAIGMWSPLNVYCYDYSRTFEIRFPILYAAEIVVAVMIKIMITQMEQKRDELLELNIRYKDDAQKANRAKSDFLASMSHEIRTPINAVLGMNEMILRESTEDNVLEYAANVDSSGRFLLSLINDILDISKIESGKMELVNTNYMLTDLVSDVMRMAYSRADEKGVEIQVMVGADIPNQLHGDSMKVRQVLTNLMTNAIKYTDSGGKVTLNASFEYSDQGHIRLNMGVRDTGKGIEKDDIPKLFDAFKRVDEKSNQAIEGSGLGLAISQRYIQMMGGEIMVESERGKGSYFYFVIPQEIRGNAVFGEYEKSGGEHHKKAKIYRQRFTAPEAHILVVDDDAMNRAVVKGLLKKTQIQMDFADSGAECLSKVEQNRYDIILLDHLMPEMDGIETLGEMRQRCPNHGAKVVALTANAISGAKQMYLDSGFDDYMAKPISGEALENKLLEYLPADKVKVSGMEDDPAGHATAQEQSDMTEGAAAQGRAGSAAQKRSDIMEQTSVQDQPAGNGLDLDKLKKWKTEFPELDVLLGLEYNIGDVEFYLEMLKMFAEQDRGVELGRYYEEQNWERYHAAVHALKSAALGIGLVRLSEEAKQLEYAVKREDYEYVRTFHGEVLRFYRECIDKIHDRI